MRIPQYLFGLSLSLKQGLRNGETKFGTWMECLPREGDHFLSKPAICNSTLARRTFFVPETRMRVVKQTEEEEEEGDWSGFHFQPRDHYAYFHVVRLSSGGTRGPTRQPHG